ncbi:MAG TPA: 16S rRNA (uracil(1498)-N(3))-methyltransferase [Thermoanaerobaculia bacterium]|jgi:RsmE family RNA methyltransferase|nr:16S rRNA (uracil(1498)-N(3))-methyltransferase [Thermoanaerobaculia bacterium]
MNLILLFESDFIDAERVRLTGRRLAHVTSVHRAAAGDSLVVGVAGGRVGTGLVLSLDPLELQVTLDRDPPPPLPLTLVLALPRPKVLNRVIAGATSLGIKRIHLINSWRVEKSYWKSPRLAEENLRLQSILGLEQARDTILPTITLHRLFRPFVESFQPPGLALVAHPSAARECPRDVSEEVTLAIGPEGGFIAQEVESLARAGFAPVSLGARILRVETAVAALAARLF